MIENKTAHGVRRSERKQWLTIQESEDISIWDFDVLPGICVLISPSYSPLQLLKKLCWGKYSVSWYGSEKSPGNSFENLRIHAWYKCWGLWIEPSRRLIFNPRLLRNWLWELASAVRKSCVLFDFWKRLTHLLTAIEKTKTFFQIAIYLRDTYTVPEA